MTTQEENWELYTLVGIAWKDAADIKGEDRDFLLRKADEIKKSIMEQRAREEGMRQRMQSEARMGTIPPSSE